MKVKKNTPSYSRSYFEFIKASKIVNILTPSYILTTIFTDMT